MEDYIFIIIAIVLSIFAAMNKSKKKKLEQMNAEEATSRQPSIFDQFFDDPVFDESVPVNVPVQPIKMEPKKLVVKEMPKPASSLEKFRMKRLEVTKRKIQTSFSEEEAREETTRETIMSDFSLRKAFVYSEIIKRKY